jgi:predicted DsbA family dithiol-disulfide isomerase
MFEAAGLPHAEPPEKVANSRGALMLAELARERGTFQVMHLRLFDAYWARGLDIGEQRVLVEEGAAVGLDEGEIIDVVREARYLGRIEAETRTAIELGAGGVPAWVIDRRVLVPGAQPHEVFDSVLERLGHNPLDGESPATRPGTSA